MNKRSNPRSWSALGLVVSALALSGCGTVGGPAADLGLAGAGGVAGYHLSDGKVGGAAAGAAVGYLGSRIAQSEIKQGQSEAEKRGYDRAMNQAVKQQYWLIQNQQRSREDASESEARLVPVVIPETNINGVIQKAHVEYLRAQ
jgi:hypothetical protein